MHINNEAQSRYLNGMEYWFPTLNFSDQCIEEAHGLYTEPTRKLLAKSSRHLALIDEYIW